MQSNPPAPGGRLRRFLFVLGSGLIVFHLTAVLCLALSAASGPWPSGDGPTMATPPQFAFTLQRDLFGRYLRPMRLGSNYRFMSNRPGLPGVVLQARLKNDQGEEIAVLEFPERDANPWARHRQAVMVGWLVPDQPVPPPSGEVVPAPGQDVPTLQVWEPAEPGKLRLQTVPQHLLPRDRPVYRPSDPSLLLVRSYARYLCRKHGAASVEMIRLYRDPLPPAVLLEDGPRDEAATVTSTYGEFPR
jgi:hypothetical protein